MCRVLRRRVFRWGLGGLISAGNTPAGGLTRAATIVSKVTMVKRLTRSAPFQIAVSWLLARYMQFCAATTRWEYRGRDHIQALTGQSGGIVAAFWHSRIALSFVAWPRSAPQKPAMLISRSKEGDFIARFARQLDIATIRGSSRNQRKDKGKGGMAAFRDMDRWVNDANCMGMTIDGPRRPRQRATMGALRLARSTGAPIMIFSWSVTHKHVANSWDRFVLPLPFARGVMIWGEPLVIPEAADPDEMERLRLVLEDRLNTITRQADEACGGVVSEPEPAIPVQAEATP